MFLDDATAHSVDRADEIAPVFGIQFFGQSSGADDVAEEDGDDATLFGWGSSDKLAF